MSNVIEVLPPDIMIFPFDVCVLNLQVKMYKRLKLVDTVSYTYNKNGLLKWVSKKEHR